MSPRPALVALPFTERDLQRQVTDIAKMFRWQIYHPFLSKWSEKGFPDLTLIRPPRLVFAELKRDKAKTTPAQDEWLELLGACPGVEVYVWRPADLDAIVAVLR